MTDEKPITVHISRETTQADWDKLDSNSWETNCRDCGHYYTGVFFNRATNAMIPEVKCPECGSTKTTGIGSPAGGRHLLLHDPTYD